MESQLIHPTQYVRGWTLSEGTQNRWRKLRIIPLIAMIGFGCVSLFFFAGYFWPDPNYAKSHLVVSKPAEPINTVTPQPRVDFLRNMQVSGPYEGEDVIRLIGFSNFTTDKIRVFVDYKSNLSTLETNSRIQIGDINSVVREVQIIYPIVHKKISPDFASYYFIGPTTNHPIKLGPSRIRVVVIGAGGEEQYYIFSLYLSDGHAEITTQNRVDNPKFLIRDDSSTPW